MREENPIQGREKEEKGPFIGSKGPFQVHVSGFQVKTGKISAFGSCLNLKPRTGLIFRRAPDAGQCSFRCLIPSSNTVIFL
jgi:hypothetical protein